jgi:hypothetical protein
MFIIWSCSSSSFTSSPSSSGHHHHHQVIIIHFIIIIIIIRTHAHLPTPKSSAQTTRPRPPMPTAVPSMPSRAALQSHCVSPASAPALVPSRPPPAAAASTRRPWMQPLAAENGQADCKTADKTRQNDVGMFPVLCCESRCQTRGIARVD